MTEASGIDPPQLSQYRAVLTPHSVDEDAIISRDLDTIEEVTIPSPPTSIRHSDTVTGIKEGWRKARVSFRQVRRAALPTGISHLQRSLPYISQPLIQQYRQATIGLQNHFRPNLRI
jgi:hypothetical protein